MKKILPTILLAFLTTSACGQLLINQYPEVTDVTTGDSIVLEAAPGGAGTGRHIKMGNLSTSLSSYTDSLTNKTIDGDLNTLLDIDVLSLDATGITDGYVPTASSGTVVWAEQVGGGGGGATTFLGLTDTPGSYGGGRTVAAMNIGGTALEFTNIIELTRLNSLSEAKYLDITDGQNVVLDSGVNGIIFQDDSGTVVSFATGAIVLEEATTFNGSVDFNNQTLNNVPMPTLSHQVASKAYADSVGGGGGSLLTANNTWTGTNQFNQPITAANRVFGNASFDLAPSGGDIILDVDENDFSIHSNSGEIYSFDENQAYIGAPAVIEGTLQMEGNVDVNSNSVINATIDGDLNTLLDIPVSALDGNAVTDGFVPKVTGGVVSWQADATGGGGGGLTPAGGLPANGVLTVNQGYYEDTFATDTWTLPASASEEDMIELSVINAAPAVVSFNTTLPYRTAGSGQISSLSLGTGNNELSFVYRNSKWRLVDSAGSDVWTGSGGESIDLSTGQWTDGGGNILDVSGNFMVDTSGSGSGIYLRDDTSSDIVIVESGQADIADLMIASTYSFPTIDGSNGQVLKTNGVGGLTWQDDVDSGASYTAAPADNGYSGPTITGINAGQILAVGDAVTINASGEWIEASAASGGNIKALGIAALGAASGNSATILTRGTIRSDTNFSFGAPGADVWTGTTAGSVGTARPSGAGEMVQYLGTSLGTTTLYFNPSGDTAQDDGN